MPWAREFASFHSGNSTPRVSFRLWLDRTEMHTVSPWTRRLKGFQVECSGRWFDCLPLLMPNELNKPKERENHISPLGIRKEPNIFVPFRSFTKKQSGKNQWMGSPTGFQTQEVGRLTTLPGEGSEGALLRPLTTPGSCWQLKMGVAGAIS